MNEQASDFYHSNVDESNEYISNEMTCMHLVQLQEHFQQTNWIRSDYLADALCWASGNVRENEWRIGNDACA